MRSFLSLMMMFILLTVHVSVRAADVENTESTCELTAVQVQQLALAFFSSSLQPKITCRHHVVKATFTAQKNPVSLIVQVPFHLVEDDHAFYGLAKYYNSSRPVKLTQWRGWSGRYNNLFMVRAPDTTLSITDKTLQFKWDAHKPIVLDIYLGPAEGAFAPLKYAYLWSWLAALCRGIEMLLVMLGSLLGNAWGLAIIVLAVLFKCLFLPLQQWVAKLQRNMDRCQAILKPKLKQIKNQYNGEEAHHRIMAEYKQLGITPFYSLKPLIGSLIQLPIQIAIFNVLGEMPQLSGVSLWWINDLAYPDTLAHLPLTVPFLGNELNLLPLLMTFLAIVSTVFMQNSQGKYRLYLMAVAFLVLFYPFPAAMVLFWTTMNLLHALTLFRTNPHLVAVAKLKKFD